MEINRFDQNGSAYLIKDLYNFINNNSTYFICDSLNTQMQDLKSMTILNQSNQLLIASEIIPIANRFTLSNPDVDNGVIINKSLFFTDSITFANQVNAINNINTLGDYYINVYTGDIATFAPPQINTLVRYRYINYNRSYMIGSPIILGALNDVNYLRIMFEQILGDDGKFYNGLPSIYGTDKINELLSVYPLYFGK